MNPPDHAPLTIVADVHACPARLSTIEALATLSLDLRRCGFALLLRGASSQLSALIELTGLEAVIGAGLESPPPERSVLVHVEPSWWSSLGAGE